MSASGGPRQVTEVLLTDLNETSCVSLSRGAHGQNTTSQRFCDSAHKGPYILANHTTDYPIRMASLPLSSPSKLKSVLTTSPNGIVAPQLPNSTERIQIVDDEKKFTFVFRIWSSVWSFVNLIVVRILRVKLRSGDFGMLGLDTI